MKKRNQKREIDVDTERKHKWNEKKNDVDASMRKKQKYVDAEGMREAKVADELKIKCMPRILCERLFELNVTPFDSIKLYRKHGKISLRRLSDSRNIYNSTEIEFDSSFLLNSKKCLGI